MTIKPTGKGRIVYKNDYVMKNSESMKLMLEIRSHKGIDAPLVIFDTVIGLQHVGNIRLALDLPWLPLECVKRSIVGIIDPVVIIQVPEAVAGYSGLFDYTPVVHIDVPDKYLNQFAEETLVVCKDDYGAVLSAHIEFVWSEQSDKLFLEHWKELGYPTEIKKEVKK